MKSQYTYSTTPLLISTEKKTGMFSRIMWTSPLIIVFFVILLNISTDTSAIVDNKLDSFFIYADKYPNGRASEQNSDQNILLKIQSGDTFGSIVKNNSLDYNQSRLLLQNPHAKTWLAEKLVIGKTLEIKIDPLKKYITYLALKIDPNTWLSATWNDKSGDFLVSLNEKQTDKQQVYAYGTIEQSLFVDATNNSVPAQVILAFANILAWDIDFAYDLRPGDSYRILYETNYIDGEQIPLYNILVAELITRNKAITAVGYKSTEDKSKEYYSIKGVPIQKPFLRMPLKFGRISSHFNLKRVHPLFKTVRPHRGTDYAAPRNTPIHSVAKGHITFRGKQRGYGNVVIIEHGRGITTLYAHMNAFVKSQKKGSKVNQGQVIGYVGSTGFATGPHVHFEFKVRGKHKNPTRVKLPNAKPLESSQLVKFFEVRDEIMHAFNIQHNAYLAVNGY